MLTTNTPNLYRLQAQDFVQNNDVWSLSLPPYLECSIIQNNHLLIPLSIVYQNDKKIIQLPVNNSINPYYLAVHIPQQGIKGQTVYMEYQYMNTVMDMFHTKNTLLIENLRPRKQNNHQDVDVPLPPDDSYIFIKSSDRLIYSINPNDIITFPAYLPKYNKLLQKITVKIKADTFLPDNDLVLSPPIALDLILFNPENNNHYVRVLSSITEQTWNPLTDDKPNYLENYGYEYGLFNINEENGFIWRSHYNEYSTEMYYVFEWKLTEKNMQNLINAFNDNKQICFKCRYAIEKYQNYYKWRNYTSPINILINTPPPAPQNLQMQKR